MSPSSSSSSSFSSSDGYSKSSSSSSSSQVSGSSRSWMLPKVAAFESSESLELTKGYGYNFQLESGIVGNGMWQLLQQCTCNWKTYHLYKPGNDNPGVQKGRVGNLRENVPLKIWPRWKKSFWADLLSAIAVVVRYLHNQCTDVLKLLRIF